MICDMPKELNTDEMIKKLNILTDLAKEKETSKNIIDRLGVVTVYSNMVDFYLIQTARLVEQIILKKQFLDGTVRSQPHEDSWFFDQQVPSRRIISKIKKILPFKAVKPQDEEGAKKVTELTKDFLFVADKYLTSRNLIFHHLTNPKKTLKDIETEIEKTITNFHKFTKAHRKFFELAQPYRFSEKEIQYFYGNKE